MSDMIVEALVIEERVITIMILLQELIGCCKRSRAQREVEVARLWGRNTDNRMGCHVCCPIVCMKCTQVLVDSCRYLVVDAVIKMKTETDLDSS